MKLVGLILFFLTFFSKLQSEGIYNAKSFQLKNGMKVVVVENKRAPVVSQMIWYNFGSGVEEKGKSGLAHFMEHLMFKGTKNFLTTIIQISFQELVEVKMHLLVTIIPLIIKYFQSMNLKKLCKWKLTEW